MCSSDLKTQKQAALSQYAETSKKTTGAEAAILRKEADLDLGQPNFVKAEMVKEGAVVIDVGTTRVSGLCI